MCSEDVSDRFEIMARKAIIASPREADSLVDSLDEIEAVLGMADMIQVVLAIREGQHSGEVADMLRGMIGGAFIDWDDVGCRLFHGFP
ncbi:hypothetical protein [Rosistilla oblonga]|uniref:hypothetical protein n=1 Tax=Rosistilla oblonga TaxID=2527990 RepID=UPI003A97B076